MKQMATDYWPLLRLAQLLRRICDDKKVLIKTLIFFQGALQRKYKQGQIKTFIMTFKDKRIH